MLPAWVRRLVAPLSLRPTAIEGTSYGDRLERLLRARAPSMAAFVVIVVAFDLVRSWSIDRGATGVGALLLAFPYAMAVGALVGPMLVEATGLRGLRLAGAMTLVTLGLVGATAAIISVWAPVPLAVRDGAVLSTEAFLYRGWWVYSMAGLLFAAYCRTREREQDVLRAAREAELARADAQREIVASRLAVLQARVEPELLFGALADVRATYLADAPRADALLDDLVAYLRAALPQMRGGASTLAREIALTEAYLRVVPAGRARRLGIVVVLPAAFVDTDFPPMVLLPLAHAAVDAGARRFHLHVRDDIGAGATRSMVMTVEGCEVPTGWLDDALGAVREALVQYLGGDASLVVVREGESTSAILAWHASTRPPAPAGTVSSGDFPPSSRGH